MKELSKLDKKILKILLQKNGRISSRDVSEEIDVPLSTIQRRRKRLEAEFLNTWCTLDITKFGWRRIEFLISTVGGLTNKIGMQLLSRSEVISAVRTIGEHTIDLKVELAVKDNAEILNLLEDIKSMKGVKDASWIEVIQLIGKKDISNYIVNNN